MCNFEIVKKDIFELTTDPPGCKNLRIIAVSKDQKVAKYAIVRFKAKNERKALLLLKKKLKPYFL